MTWSVETVHVSTWILVKHFTLFPIVFSWRNWLHIACIGVQFAGGRTGWMTGLEESQSEELNLVGGWSPVTSPRDHFWGCFEVFIIDLFEGIECTLRKSLQTTPSQADLLICLRAGHLCRGIWVGQINGLRPTTWHSTRVSAGACTLVVTTPWSDIGLGKSGWKVAWQKKSWGCSSKARRTQARIVPRWPRRPRAPGVYQK